MPEAPQPAEREALARRPSGVGRRAITLGLTGMLAARAGRGAFAASYPDRPVRVVVGFTPGGGIDLLGRLIAGKLSERLGQAFFIDNRPGANGAIAANFVARVAPDGATILLVTTSHALNAVTVANPPYDAVKDFEPVTMIASFPNVLVVNGRLGVNSAADLIRLLKAAPDRYNFASTGVGGATHLAAEAFQAAAGVKLLHVPYNGAGPAMLAVLSGEVAVYFGTVAGSRPFVDSGQVKLLMVTSRDRVAALPQVPSAAEAGLPSLVLQSFYGILAPARTPPAIVDALQGAVAATLGAPDIRRQIESEGAVPSGSTPEEFATFLQEEIDRLRPIAQRANLVSR